MSIVEVKENAVNLLELIIKRWETIEKQSGRKNLLEIDLAMEDIRLLYREMERLRKYTEAEGIPGSLHMRQRASAQPATEDHKMQQDDMAPADIAGDKVEDEKKAVEENVPEEPVAGKPAPKQEQQPAQEEPEKKQEKEASEPLMEQQQSPAPPVQPPAEKDTPKEEELPGRETADASPPPQQEKVAQTHQHEHPPQQDAGKKAEAEQQKPSGSRPDTSRQKEMQQPAADTQKTKEKDQQEHHAGKKKVIAEALKEQKPVVGESFGGSNNSVYERLASIRDDKSIGAQMQYKPVKSIREAIGVNEKFLFINELFNGDLEAYNSWINELNSCGSIHEAFELLNTLTREFQWDGRRSADTIEKFANLVQRRYM